MNEDATGGEWRPRPSADADEALLRAAIDAVLELANQHYKTAAKLQLAAEDLARKGQDERAAFVRGQAITNTAAGDHIITTLTEALGLWPQHEAAMAEEASQAGRREGGEGS